MKYELAACHDLVRTWCGKQFLLTWNIVTQHHIKVQLQVRTRHWILINDNNNLLVCYVTAECTVLCNLTNHLVIIVNLPNHWINLSIVSSSVHAFQFLPDCLMDIPNIYHLLVVSLLCQHIKVRVLINKCISDHSKHFSKYRVQWARGGSGRVQAGSF